LPSRDEGDCLRGGGVALLGVDDLAARDVDAVLRGEPDLRHRPTSTGSLIASAAVIIAPRSEGSSQGWATTVTAGVPSRASAIRRSYFVKAARAGEGGAASFAAGRLRAGDPPTERPASLRRRRQTIG
jgi:hypothetical protein